MDLLKDIIYNKIEKDEITVTVSGKMLILTK